MQQIVIVIFITVAVTWTIRTSIGQTTQHNDNIARKQAEQVAQKITPSTESDNRKPPVSLNETVFSGYYTDADSILTKGTIKDVAMKYYTLFERMPPRGFGEWVKLSIANQCVLEVPRLKWLLEDLEPFRRMTPAAYRARVELLKRTEPIAYLDVAHLRFEDSKLIHKEKPAMYEKMLNELQQVIMT